MAEKPTGRRFIFVDVALTDEQRTEMKRHRIKEALEWEPPRTVTREQEVKPDDPRYEKAPIQEVWHHITSIPINSCSA